MAQRSTGPARVATQNLLWSEFSQEWLIEHFGSLAKDSKNDTFPDCVINADALFQCLSAAYPGLKGFELVDVLKDAVNPTVSNKAWIERGLAAGADPACETEFAALCDLFRTKNEVV